MLLKNWLYKDKLPLNFKALTLLSWCFVFLSFFSKGQINLVENPSFEIYSNCPTAQSQIKYATGWDTLKAGGGGSPDYYNACDLTTVVGVPYSPFGFQYSRTGSGHSMIILYFTISQDNREYIQSKLKKILSQNKTYCVTAYVNLHNYSNLAIDQIGIYLDEGTVNSLPGNVVQGVVPQIISPVGSFIIDTLNWHKIQGTIIANGTEEYLTIGNFKTDALTNSHILQPSTGYYALYNVDDVSVVETNAKAYAGQDKLVCLGDSVFIGAHEEALDCQWFNNNTQIAQSAGIWVKPNTNQQYVIQQNVCGNVSYDTVQVKIRDIDCNPTTVESEIPNTFTPNGDGINDVWQFTLSTNSILNTFEIYNRWGSLIHQNTSNQTIVNLLWDGRTTSGESCSDGVYFYVLKYTNSKDEQQNKKGYISLFR